MTRRRAAKHYLQAGALIASIATAAGCASSNGATSPGGKSLLTFVETGVGTNAVNPGAASQTIATKLGYWSSCGIKVEEEATSDPVALLQSGTAISGEIDMGTQYSKVHTVPSWTFVAYDNQFISPVIRFTSRVGSGINSIADIKAGDSIGIFNASAAGLPEIQALLRQNGVDPTKVSYPVLSSPPAIANAIEHGTIQAMLDYDILNAQVEQLLPSSVKLQPVELPTSFAHMIYGANIAKASVIASHLSEFVCFERGEIEGTLFQLTNPKVAAEIELNTYPELQSPGQSQAAAVSSIEQILLAQNADMAPPTWADPRLPMYIFPSQWDAYKTVYGYSVPLQRLFTTKILKLAYAKVDVSAIERQAKDYKVG